MPASRTGIGSMSPSTETAIEQQMSAECMPGWIASLAAMTPPTGIVPVAVPAGQASGMTAPATMVGTRISSAMCRSTEARFSASCASSARMLSRCFERAVPAQRYRRWRRRRREPVDDGANSSIAGAGPACLLGRRNRRSEPRARRVAPRDQGLARNRRHDYCALETLSSAMAGHGPRDLPEPRRFGLICR